MAPGQTPLPPPLGRRRPRRAFLAGLGVLCLLGYGAALGLANRTSVRAALRERIERTVRARLPDATVGPAVRIDPLFRLSFGPLTVPGAKPGDPAVVVIERLKVRPRLWPLLLGRAEAASIGLSEVTIQAGPDGRALRELFTRLTRPPPRRPGAAAPRPAADEPAEEPALHVRGLVVHLTLGGRDLELGPLDGILRRAREDGSEQLRVEVALPGGGRATLSARREAEGWHGQARLAEIRPAALPAALADLPVALCAGAVSVELRADAAADLGHVRSTIRVTADQVALRGERLGPRPVGPLSARGEGRLSWDGTERRLALRDGAVEVGAARVTVTGEARLGPGVPFTLEARADGLDFLAFIGTLPPSLAPPVEAPRPAGTLDARLQLSGPLVAPGAWSVQASLDLSRMRDAAKKGEPVALRGPFVHRPEGEVGEARPALVVGPRAPDFVPLAQLPVHVYRAVTTAEDGGFFGHEGFDFAELRNAVAEGALRGRVVRGGSTITQQLAKNLYLSREKTFARKVREALATIALEATVPKARLLEIYLNVAEWAPGVWGIGPAARHWFGKDARALTPKEAAFLATVIPGPRRYHFMWFRGAPTENWEQHVNELLLRMNEQGALDDDALAEAVSEPLRFASGGAPVAGAAPPAPAKGGTAAP